MGYFEKHIRFYDDNDDALLVVEVVFLFFVVNLVINQFNLWRD